MWVRRVNKLNHSREWRWIGKGSGEEADGGDDHVLSGGLEAQVEQLRLLWRKRRGPAAIILPP